MWDLPGPGIETVSLALQGRFLTTGEADYFYYSAIKKNSFESVLMRWMKLEPII